MSRPEDYPESHERYIVNGLRRDFELPAVPVRRGDQDARDLVGERSTVVPPDQVQAHVEARRCPGAGDDAALIEIQGLRPHPHPREPPRELVRVLPVRGDL